MNFFPQIEFNIITIVFFVFCFAVLLQLLFLLLFPRQLFRKKHFANTLIKTNYPKVTVIVCSRNEEDSLAKNLPLILDQDYPEFEVIVVNDQSMDESAAVIKAFQTKHKNLRLIDLERNMQKRIGKKLPLTIGIKGAKHEHLVMTDVDCRPASNQWLKKMVAGYQTDKEIVLGYSPYASAKGFLNKIIRFDTAMIGANYLSFALAGRAYMGVGRNLSYKRDLFFEVDGFKAHYHVQSGDDDLFVQAVAKKKNVAVQIASEAHVLSAPKTTWKEWIKQKRRHFTTAPEYRLINKFLLGIFPLSMFLMLTSFVILLVNYEWWLLVLAIFSLRTIIYWLVYSKILKKLNENDLRAWFPVMEIVHFVIIPFIYYATNRTSNTKW